MEFDLSYVIQYLPGFVYWKNIRSEYMGCNDNLLHIAGCELNEFIGKTDDEFSWGKEYANNFKADDEEVIKTGQLKITEHKLLMKSERDRYMWIRTEKRPFYNAAGQVIGVLAIATDITTQKENERLTVENERTRIQLQEREAFRKIVGQAVHDIGSPLASLGILVKMGLDSVSEQDRGTLRDIATRISDIAANLLTYYRPEHTDAKLTKKRRPVLISLALRDLLAEKKHQYQGRSVSFETDLQPDCHFAFAELEESEFKRMLSNLINNAVDAFEGQPGVVTLGFAAEEALIKLAVKDNGKGMSGELVHKITNNIAVTEGKEGGHGIGLTQVREMIQRNQGTFAIDSEVGKGTTIHITFPRIHAPVWTAEQITINREDTVVILDDESSIHNLWDTYFTSVAPEIPLVHFTQADEATAFINGFAQKERIFLLIDYELLQQPCNGLAVIEQTQIKRALLVTSHYAIPGIQEQATKSGVTVLPKQLAAEFPIVIYD
ncbi:MAG: sensor histidine kinase [Enterobacteriaceae bacterium]